MAAATSARIREISRVVQGWHPLPDLQEGVGARGCDFMGFKLGLRELALRGQNHIHRSGHLNVHGDQFEDWGSRSDHLVVLLGIIQQIHIGDELYFGGVGMWVWPVKTLRPYFGRLDNQRSLGMVPVGRFFVLGVGRAR